MKWTIINLLYNSALRHCRRDHCSNLARKNAEKYAISTLKRLATSRCQSTTRWRHRLLLPEKPLAVAYLMPRTAYTARQSAVLTINYGL